MAIAVELGDGETVCCGSCEGVDELLGVEVGSSVGYNVKVGVGEEEGFAD